MYDPPIALTPKSAIAEPTSLEGIKQTPSEAVPASSFEPTLATMIPTAEPNGASTMESTGKIQNSTPGSTHANTSPTAAEEADGEQTGHHSPSLIDTAPMRLSHGADPPVHTIPTKEPGNEESPQVEHTVLNDPGSKSSIPDDRQEPHEIETASATRLDALSVFLAAQSSIDALTSKQGHADQMTPPDLLATRISPAKTLGSPSGDRTPSTQLDSMAAGDLVPAHGAGSSAVVEQAGSPLTVRPDIEVSTDAHVFSAASDGGAITVDHSVTHEMLPSGNRPSALPTSVVGEDDDDDDDVATAAHSRSSVVVLADDVQTLTVPLGGAVTINSHGNDIAADGHALVAGSSTVIVPANDALVETVSTAVWTSDGSKFTAVMQGSSVILHLPTTTATLTADATTTIAGEAFGVPVSGSMIEHGSSTLTLRPVHGGDPGEATMFLQDGQKLIASAAKDGIIIQQGTSTITLAAGQGTTFNGHTLSAARSEAASIVDGSAMTITPTGLPNGSVEAASDTQSANAADTAGATDTMKVITSSASTPESSDILDTVAVGSAVNTSLCLVLLCLASCMWTCVVLV